MTLDQAVALSILTKLPRTGLTARLKERDPALLDQADRALEVAREARRRAAALGIDVVAWNDPAYPPALLEIPDCPPVLWTRGDPACLSAPVVAIVGSRAASPAALETADELAAGLAARGVTVVSGLARGVDSAAHRGALRTGRTAAVLGSGLDRVYPAEHADLARRIAGSGLVASECPPGAPPLPHHFPLRNRIISGVSRAVVVIEASERSGSLITAACALEQGRDVMAVPGTVLGGRNRGGHALIRDGARIVETADDVLEELGLAVHAPASTRAAAADDPVLRVMLPGATYDLDQLAACTGLDLSRLLQRLLDLELRGRVERAGAGHFMRRERTC